VETTDLLLEIPKLLLFEPYLSQSHKIYHKGQFCILKGVRALPSMGKHYRVPQSLVIEATKIKITA